MRKHTKRKRYPAGHILTPAQRDALVTPVHMAMAALELGAGHENHRHTLAAFSNLAATPGQQHARRGG